MLAFSAAHRRAYAISQTADVIEMAPRLREDHWTVAALFAGVVEAVEEAVLNSLVAAETMAGCDGRTVYVLPRDELRELLASYHRP